MNRPGAEGGEGGGPATGLLHALVDRLAAEFAEDPWREAIAQARAEFLERAGKVFEDDGELFEARAQAFLEWYVLDRPLAEGPPPVLRALESAREPAERRALASLAASHRSLFDLAAVDGRNVLLEDLIGGARFAVAERRSTAGFQVGDVVEARIWWDGAEVAFGKTFLFHPRDARDQVLDLVDAALARGAARDEILFQLSRLHLRWHRHGHISAARVYAAGA